MSQPPDYPGIFILALCGLCFLMGSAFTASLLLSIDGILGEIRKFREEWRKR